MKPETATFTTVVPIADVNGNPIREGSVLREINDGERGVVVRIVRPGDMGSAFDSAGDLHIRTGRGTTRVTNRYSQWAHIPHNDQTYEERLHAWLKTPYEHCQFRCKSKDEDIAIDGIMALLPDDAVDYDYDSGPHSIEDALGYLVAHLTQRVAHPQHPIAATH